MNEFDFPSLVKSVNALASTHDAIARTLRMLLDVTEEQFITSMTKDDLQALIDLLRKTEQSNSHIHEGLFDLIKEDPLK